ncbi:AMP-binding protein [Myxococcus sp. MxC21-1]|nr:thioesterase domain-containing protein [Myxococcus sp. MxC21-1]WNZ58697.1 AMP-binding protein [Myxococcus sp. MxC21-1]
MGRAAARGKLVVYPEGPLELEAVGQRLKEAGVTSLWLTAALFEQMQAYQPEALSGVRQVLAGGDVLSVGRVRERVRSGGILLNGYGPTEGTTFTTVHRVAEEDVGLTVPIGKPVGNTRVYVLDEGMRPVPVGVRGELYVGGEGLAEGYVGRPEWTAERFVPSPFGEGERLYRTGDEVRWQEGGVLEFLGRRDAQVKVRGYRIELGEVEEALKQHTQVKEAAAVVRGEGQEKRVEAYVVAPGGEGGALKEYVRQKLPEYMVPSVVVVLEALPLTPNGKVDRKALAATELRSRVAAETFVTPRTDAERVLAGIFSEVLGVPRVGLHDDFFELGGHSLLATQVVARVRTELGVDMPLRALFEAPTVLRLAVWLLSSDTEAGARDCVALQPEGAGTPVFLVHAVGGAVGPYRALARSMGRERPLYGFQAAGLDGREPPLEQVEAIARRYVDAMRERQPKGPYVLGGWSLGGVVAFEMARELERQGQSVALLVLLDSFAPGENAPSREPDAALLLAGMAMDLARTAGAESTLRPEALSGLTEEAQFTAVVEHARQAGWLPPEVEASTLRAWRDVTRANLRALAAYRPGPVQCPVLLLRAKDAQRSQAVEPSHGWARWGLSGLTVEDVPGDHYSVLRAPRVETLARRLVEHVGAATGRHEAAGQQREG